MPEHAASTARAELEAFGRAYRYDTGYLIELAASAPEAFETFRAAQGMSHHRKALPLDAHFVARVATMQAEDCGACGQLNLRMAREAGVERELLRTLIDDPSRLPEPLRDVRDHALGVCAGAFGPEEDERGERLRAAFGEEAFHELAVVIAGCRIYPTLKRSLLQPQACEPLRLDG